MENVQNEPSVAGLIDRSNAPERRNDSGETPTDYTGKKERFRIIEGVAHRSLPRASSMQRLEQVIAAQNEVATTRLDLGAVMQRVTERVRTITAADGAVVELAEGDDMVYRAAAGSAAPYIGVRLKINSSLSGLCVRLSTALYCADADNDDRVDREACQRIGIRSMLCVPLFTHEGEEGKDRQTVGVLKVHSPFPEAFTDEDRYLLELMAGLIAAALRNAAEADARQRLLQERTAALAALAESNARFELALTAMQEGLVIHNSQGEIMVCNPAAQNILGLSQEQMVGRTTQDPRWQAYREDGTLWPGEERPSMVALREGCTVQNAVMGMDRPDGSRVWLNVSAAPLYAPHPEDSAPTAITSDCAATSEQAGAVALFSDITARVAAERALAEHSRQLELANAELLEARDKALTATRTKSAFLASMSHEIRTPMNGIIGMTNHLLDSPLTADQREQAETIRDSANALLTILNDILDFSKIEAGKLAIESVPFRPAAILEETLSLLREIARGKQIALKVETSPMLPGVVRGDPVRLRQIFMNLIGNAIKFTPRGGTVTVEALPSPAGSEIAPDLIEFRVTDTGIGISPEVQARLFTPFTQADAATARHFGGTGLGLAISRQLVELMGGRITLTSVLGQGSVFRFTARLPREIDTPAALGLETAKLGVASRPIPQEQPPLLLLPDGDFPARPPRILLAEDNTVNQKVAMRLLEKWGCLVDIASNGMEALASLEAHSTRPYDMVLMDCHMPEMDGFEATRELRRREAEDRLGQRLPVIALTASAMEEDRQACLAAGMDDFATKPVTNALLRATMERWLKVA